MSYTKNVYHIIFGTKRRERTRMRESGHFPHWQGWAEGYAEFTCSFYSMQRVLDYVKNQKQHHAKISFSDELRGIFSQLGIDYDERYML